MATELESSGNWMQNHGFRACTRRLGAARAGDAPLAVLAQTDAPIGVELHQQPGGSERLLVAEPAHRGIAKDGDQVSGERKVRAMPVEHAEDGSPVTGAAWKRASVIVTQTQFPSCKMKVRSPALAPKTSCFRSIRR